MAARAAREPRPTLGSAGRTPWKRRAAQPPTTIATNCSASSSAITPA